MKEKVIIGEMEDDKVAVYYYDDFTKKAEESPFEVCHMLTAREQYDVVGELTFGDIYLYENGGEEEDDFSEFSLVDEEIP